MQIARRRVVGGGSPTRGEGGGSKGKPPRPPSPSAEGGRSNFIDRLRRRRRGHGNHLPLPTPPLPPLARYPPTHCGLPSFTGFYRVSLDLAEFARFGLGAHFFQVDRVFFSNKLSLGFLLFYRFGSHLNAFTEFCIVSKFIAGDCLFLSGHFEPFSLSFYRVLPSFYRLRKVDRVYRVLSSFRGT